MTDNSQLMSDNSKLDIDRILLLKMLSLMTLVIEFWETEASLICHCPITDSEMVISRLNPKKLNAQIKCDCVIVTHRWRFSGDRYTTFKTTSFQNLYMEG